MNVVGDNAKLACLKDKTNVYCRSVRTRGAMDKAAVLVTVLSFAITASVSFARTRETQEIEFAKHRIDLLEEGLKNYVYEAQPRIRVLEDEIGFLKEENVFLNEQLQEQRAELQTLQWATSDTKRFQITEEERNVVEELKWTIFDLKEANRELQEEACHRNTMCKDWQEWSRCSVDCGHGTRVRIRRCIQEGRFSSMCTPDNFQEEPCVGNQCAILDTISQLDCRENYTSYQGYCLRFSGRQDTRLLSTILCQDEGGHLAYIDSPAKQKVVWDFIGMSAPEYMPDLDDDVSKHEFWDFKDIDQNTNVAVDGIRKHQRTEFVNWRDEVMSYFNWAVGQPRNDRSDGDYCATMNVLTGEWYMKCCSVTFFYVCETDYGKNN